MAESATHTQFAANAWRVGTTTTPIIDLLDHLDAMADYVELGGTNALAAGTARELIYDLIDRLDDIQRDLDSAQGNFVQPGSAIDRPCKLAIP
jgi:hypothetical protein